MIEFGIVLGSSMFVFPALCIILNVTKRLSHNIICEMKSYNYIYVNYICDLYDQSLYARDKSYVGPLVRKP